VNYCDRTLTECAYHYALCLTPEEFYAELKRIGLSEPHWPEFLVRDGHATTHHFTHDGQRIALVTLNTELAKTKTGAQIAALLVHEAVHIWQRHAVAIGAFNDHGDEEEAYAIQNIAQCLMTAYADRMTAKEEQ